MYLEREKVRYASAATTKLSALHGSDAICERNHCISDYHRPFSIAPIRSDINLGIAASSDTIKKFKMFCMAFKEEKKKQNKKTSRIEKRNERKFGNRRLLPFEITISAI